MAGLDLETCSLCVVEWPWNRLREYNNLGFICPDCYREEVNA